MNGSCLCAHFHSFCGVAGREKCKVVRMDDDAYAKHFRKSRLKKFIELSLPAVLYKYVRVSRICVSTENQ